MVQACSAPNRDAHRMDQNPIHFGVKQSVSETHSWSRSFQECGLLTFLVRTADSRMTPKSSFGWPRRKSPHLLFIPCTPSHLSERLYFFGFLHPGYSEHLPVQGFMLCFQSACLFSRDVSKNPSGEAVSQWWEGRSPGGISELWDTAGRVEMLWIGTRHLRKQGDSEEKTKHC